MSSIVLKIPYESQSFHAALTDATLRDRVLEWVAAAVTLDDAIYIPLRTDWMPNGTRRTADGVEVLVVDSVQRTIVDGRDRRKGE